MKFNRFFKAVNYFYQFQTFVIADPAVAGANTATSGSAGGDCATDTFAVSAGGGGKSSPIICGTNTGQHGEYLLDTIQDFFVLIHFFHNGKT